MTTQKIYIVLTDTGTLFTRMIKLYTRKPYNHASISFDHHLEETYSFGRKSTRNPFIGGFVKENTQGSLFNQADCAIYSCTVTKIQIENMKHYIHKIEENKHLYKYNFLGLFAFLFNKQIKREHAFFCSEFVATLLHHCDVIHFDKPLTFVTPYDLQLAPQVELIYRGKLADFLSEHRVSSSINTESGLLI